MHRPSRLDEAKPCAFRRSDDDASERERDVDEEGKAGVDAILFLLEELILVTS